FRIMSSTAPAASAPQLRLDRFEQLAKLGASVLAIVYAVGFLVVSIHHGRFGILMFEFLRARVFAAGLLLTIFMIVPIVAVSRSFSWLGLKWPGGTKRITAANWKYAKICALAQFCLVAYGLAVAALPLFNPPPT